MSGFFGTGLNSKEAERTAAPKTPQAVFGVGGHGLLLAVPVDTRVTVELDESLTLERNGFVVRLVPGGAPATEPPVQVGEEWTTGPGGPRIISVGGPSAFELIVVRADVGLGSGEWTTLLRGAFVQVPRAVTVHTDGELAGTEWRLGGLWNQVFKLELREADPSTIEIRPAAYQNQTGVGESDGLRWIEFAYVHDEEPWLQRVYATAWPGGAVVARAQVPHEFADLMWVSVELALKSMSPAP